jgi:mycothiol synthase
MDSRLYAVRPFATADLEEYSRMFARVYPDHPMPVDVFRIDWESHLRLPEPPFWRVVTERSTGAMVAAAGIARNLRADDPRRPWVFGDVAPEHRGRGIGTYLFDEIRAEAGRRGLSALRARVRADPPSTFAFLEKRGFVEQRRSWVAALEIAHADTTRPREIEQRLVGEGIRFTSLAEEGSDSEEVLRRVFALVDDTSADIPRVGQYTPISFEQHREFDTAGDGYRPELWMLAKVRSEYVGISVGYHNPALPKTLAQALTGTRRDYRRRGIAEVLKARLIEYARAHGYDRIETSTDSSNQPMWALNERIGFRKSGERIFAECRLEGPG